MAIFSNSLKYCLLCWLVGGFVHLLVMTMDSGKTADLVEMLFEIVSGVDPKESCIR